MAVLRWLRLCFFSGMLLLSGMQAAMATPFSADNVLKLTKTAGSGNEFTFTLGGDFDSFGGGYAFIALTNLTFLDIKPLAGLADNPDNLLLFPDATAPDFFSLSPVFDADGFGPSGSLNFVSFVTRLIDPSQSGSISLLGSYDYAVFFEEVPNDGPTRIVSQPYSADIDLIGTASLQTPGELPEAPVMLTFATGLAFLAWSRRRAAMRA